MTGNLRLVARSRRKVSNAVQLGHLDVERHEVDRRDFEARKRQQAVRGSADDLDVWISRQHVGDQASDHDGVINHENTNWRHDLPIGSDWPEMN